jgi:PAS domain S-box-containing protein
VGLHIVSGEGIILRANKAELDLLGYPNEEYVSRHIAEFHADAPTIGDILQRLSRGQRLARYPARLRAKDGSIRDVLITSNGRFEQGRLVSTRCFTTDVTDLREAESALRESQDRLAATYEAATIGIAEANDQDHLLRALQDVGTFTRATSSNELPGLHGRERSGRGCCFVCTTGSG